MRHSRKHVLRGNKPPVAWLNQPTWLQASFVKCMQYGGALAEVIEGEMKDWQRHSGTLYMNSPKSLLCQELEPPRGVAAISKYSLVGLRSHQSADSSELGTG